MIYNGILNETLNVTFNIPFKIDIRVSFVLNSCASFQYGMRKVMTLNRGTNGNGRSRYTA
jgi:hypothetical protein